MNETQQVVLIVGASSGVGYHAALHLSRRGFKVYGTSRKPKDRFAEDGRSYPFKLIELDVDYDASVESAFASIMRSESRLDVVVNSAGYGLAGAVEDTSIDEATKQFETNFFGVLRVCRAALPIMRRQSRGYIVNVSSIGGVLGIPFQSIYSASKFALEGLSEALRMEVEPYGIRVVLIQPGNYRTEFTANRVTAVKADRPSPYYDLFTKALSVMEKDELEAPEPEEVARVIERAVLSDSPRLRYVVDPSIGRFAPMLKRVLPYSVVEAALKRVFKLV
jgi:NAD(P)-dependent dehydrogenase (short-subunit alcohol dehydrogenase family)